MDGLTNPGFKKTSDGALYMVERTGEIPATATRINGIAVDSTGAIYVVIV